MEMHELTRLLTVLGPIFGVVGTVLGIAVWVIKAHIQSKNDQITQLKLDKQTLEAEVAKEKANAQKFQYDREDAHKRRDEAERSVAPLTLENASLKQHLEVLKKQAADNKAEADKNKAEAERYLTAAQQQQSRRREIESRVEKAEGEAKSAKVRAEKSEADAKLAAETAKKREESLGLSVVTANKMRSDAEKKAKDIQAELDKQVAIASALEKQIELVANQDGRVWEAALRPGIPPFVPLSARGTPIISLLNLKGGVGKTTLTANLAAYLSEHEQKRVLVIDLDHQRSLSQLLLSPKERELADDAGHTIQRFLRDPVKDGTALLACARPVPGLEKVRIITNTDPRAKPGQDESQTLDDLEMRLMSAWLILPRAADVRFLLLPALQSKTIQSQFDYILIDCPPRLTTACINALVGSDYLLIPTQAEPVALSSVYHLIRRLLPLRNCGVLPELKILGIVANMVRPGGVLEDSHERDLLVKAGEAASLLWGREITCLETLMRRHDNYAEACRYLQVGDSLRMGIHYKGPRDDITALISEIRSIVDHESSSVATVPS